MSPPSKDIVSSPFFPPFLNANLNLFLLKLDKIFHRKGSNSINRKNIQIETDKRIFSLDEQSVQVPGKFSKKIDDSPF